MDDHQAQPRFFEVINPEVARKECSSANPAEQLHSSQDPSTTEHKKITDKEAPDSNNYQDDTENSAPYCLSFDIDQNSLKKAKTHPSCKTADQSLPPDLLADTSAFSPYYKPISFTDYFFSDSPKSLNVANTASYPGTLYSTHDMLMDCSDTTFQSVEEWQADMGNPKQEQTQEKGKGHGNSPAHSFVKHLEELDVCGGHVDRVLLVQSDTRQPRATVQLLAVVCENLGQSKGSNERRTELTTHGVCVGMHAGHH